MKQSRFRATCLILMACIAVLSAFGDEQIVVLETRILETFHNDGESQYAWQVRASKFATQTDEDSFPKLAYVDAWPEAVFGHSPEKEVKSLGIWGNFDRRGHNWIDIYPAEAGADAATVIPIPGRIQSLDMWVWGSNLRYSIEAYFRDYRGTIHVINLGSINHTGWRNVRATIPSSIPQTKTVLPRFAPLEFLKFRIWTDPTERVNDFYIFFNQFKIVTDIFETPYDGTKLEDTNWVQGFFPTQNNNGGE